MLSNSGSVTSMTDISDGLSVSLSDLSHAPGIDELERIVDFTVIGSVVAKGSGDEILSSGYDHFEVRKNDFYASK